MQLDADLLAIQEVRDKLNHAKIAQQHLEQLDQQQIDLIVENMFAEAVTAAKELAQLAVEETGFGNVEDKVKKNLFAAEQVYHSIKNIKTVGIINEDAENQIWEIADPVGIIAGVVPSTNPTSTIIFKSLIALKTRNAIIFSPHPSALKCSLLAAKIMNQAAEKSNAPEKVIQCLSHPSLEATNELMSHKWTKLILATGGPGMVKSAYSSGKPAYGVGPGNVPVYVHSSADIQQAARQIIESKSFDYGTICASEQAIIVDEKIKNKLMRELQAKGAYFLNEAEKEKLSSVILIGGHLNPNIVGRSSQALAKMAGFQVDSSIKVLIAEEQEMTKKTPFSIEKLSPILSIYTVQNWEEGCEVGRALLKLGGLGHTFGIHALDEQIIKKVAIKQPASRIVINTGTTFGAIGATTELLPSMTLGCGSYGNNITSDNIGPNHLLNIKRVAFGIRNMELNQVEEPAPQHKEFMFDEAEIATIVRKIIGQLT